MAKRFPQSMLAYVKVVQAQPLIACPTSEHGVTVEEHARYAGRQAAFAWVLQIFDGTFRSWGSPGSFRSRVGWV